MKSFAIGGETKLLGLVGEEISYTRSPSMHNRATQILHFDQVYVPFPMKAEAVAAFLEVFWQIGGVGLNVTTPHKKLVAKLVQEKTGAAVPVSVNTLFRNPDSPAFWSAASTDGAGFVAGLKRIGVKAEILQELVILGAGGATIALLEHLSHLGDALQKITVLRREAREDEQLKAAVAANVKLDIKALTLASLTKTLSGKGSECLLIQATNAPQKGDDLKELTPALKDFGGIVSDLVYGKPSALYFKALAQDLVAQDGEAMLIEQARLSQKLWWGKMAAYDDMATALRGK